MSDVVQEEEYPRMKECLISAQELNYSLNNRTHQDIRVVAVCPFHDFLTGHIPGSIQTWRPDYEDPNSHVSGMILNQNDFQKFAREKLCISDLTLLVFYDYNACDSTRLWWACKLYGKNSKVLNGGFQAWTLEGFPIDYFPSETPSPTEFICKTPLPFWRAEIKDVFESKDNENIQLWDVREIEEYEGTKLLLGAFRKGRIPWNSGRWDYRSFHNQENQKFISENEMKIKIKEYGIDPNKIQIFYCQSGVRTTQAMFCLYLLGYDEEKLRNYDGSWIEWSKDEKNPIFKEKDEEECLIQ